MLHLKQESVEWLCSTALLMALNVVLSSFSIPVPGGHLYLCDVAICTAALLFDPLAAFIVGGVGSFIGDMLFYPPPMFVSLVSHGLQALVISLIARSRWRKHHTVKRILAVMAGALVMIIGYTLGRCYIYATPEYALLKLPFEFLQAFIGAAAGLIITGNQSLQSSLNRIFQNQKK